MTKIFKIVIASLIGLLVVAAVGFGYWYVKNSKIKNGGAGGPAAEKVQNGEAAANRLEEEKKKCETVEDKENCLNGVYNSEALNSLDIEFCSQITEAPMKQNCVTEIAVRKNDEKLCEGQEDTAVKDFCLSLILSGKARETNDMATCLKVPDQSYRDSCFNAIVSSKADPGFCDTLGDFKNKCLDLVNFNAAFAKADLSLCEQITDEVSRGNCIYGLGSADSDGDGLTNIDEKKYGTNPLNPDTDGDSYKDGDEVKAGYNPNGPGKL